MKHIITIFMLFITSSFVFANDNLISVKLEKILDGDTIRVQFDDNQFDIRLKGIDCYETNKRDRAYKQAYLDNLKIEEVIEKGQNSKKALETMYKKSNKKVSFEFKGVDYYGRVLGIVYFDNTNINEELKTNGNCGKH